MGRRIVGNSGGKYDFAPEEFEKDIQNKNAVYSTAYNDCVMMIEQYLRCGKYRYRDGQPLLPDIRWRILMEAALATREKYGFK